MLEKELDAMKPKEEFTCRVMLAIRGRVVSQTDGSPIPEARVILEGQPDTFTDASGTYQIELGGDQATSGRLWVQAKGYPTYVNSFQASATENQVIYDVMLNPDVATSVSGRLLTPEGQPIRKASVQGNSLPEPAITDDDGYFRCDGFKAYQRFGLRTKPAGYLLKEVSFTIAEPGHLDLGDIVLEKARAISGRVTDLRGEPVSGAFVHAAPSWERINAGIGHKEDDHLQTGADGRYILRAVRPEKGDEDVHVLVFATDYGMAAQKVKFGEAERLDGVDFQLETGEKISGIVTDDTGSPMEALRVVVYGLNYHDTRYVYLDERFTTDSDTEGRFCIEGLPKTAKELTALGIYDASQSFLSYEANQNPIEVGMTDVQITVSPSGYITGQVVDAETGEPIPSFCIQLGYPKAATREEIINTRSYALAVQHAL